MSRSATAVVAYLMRRDGLNVEEAVERVKDRRAIVE